jgi:hypothetical protein
MKAGFLGAGKAGKKKGEKKQAEAVQAEHPDLVARAQRIYDNIAPTILDASGELLCFPCPVRAFHRGRLHDPKYSDLW